MDEAVRPMSSIADFVRGYEEGVAIHGFRSECGFTTVTWALACPRCGARDLRPADLGRAGRVLAFSVQHVPTEEFVNDAPYAYLVVELDGGGRVTGWMPDIREESELAVGDRVRYVRGYRPGLQFEKDGTAHP